MFRCQLPDCLNIKLKIDPTSSNCNVCKELFCSIDCKQRHKCIPKTQEQLQGEYKAIQLLFNMDKVSYVTYPQVAGKPMMPLPGPIKGPISKKMIPIREKPYYDLLSPEEKLHVDATNYYYYVLPKDMYTVWQELTTEQKKAIDSMTK